MTKPITVFVADDHAIVRDGLTQILAGQPDIEVVGTAANGREALQQILVLQPSVVVLDISMPELDGLEVMRRLLEARPGLPIVILSMHCGAHIVFNALEAGARGYLLKESAGREVIDAVRAIHEGRRYLSPEAAAIVAEGIHDRRGASPLDSLSRREREILKLVADGNSSAAIGRLLHLSPKTVDTYRSRLMQKLQITDVTGLVKFAIQFGITQLE